jgi:hypothetical protein
MDTRQTTFSERSFLLKIYVASIAVIGFYLVSFPVLKPNMVKVSLLIILGSAFIGGYFVTLRSKGHIRSSHYYIICCYLVLLMNALVNGGIGAPGIIWLLICPLIAFITLSTHAARVWLIITLATVALLFAFKHVLPENKFENQEVWYLASYIFFFPMVYSIMRIFRKEVSKKNVELNLLNERLSAEREMLKKTQNEILCQTARIKDAETKALERSSKLTYYLDQLIEVKRMEEVHSGNIEYSVKAILQFLQKSMMLQNVALWHLYGTGQALELFRYSGDGADVYERALIQREQFSDAYDMLETGAIINQCDNTKEAAQLRLLFQHSQGNHAMINCPYFLDGKFAGFISCRSSEKTWMAEDIIFVRAISDSISLAFKSHHRKLQQQMLEQKQLEITEINESLEKKVMERTNQLNLRNKQLTDFSFTNAHDIRGPICRLLGLKNLLTAVDDCQEVFKISNYMRASIEELDRITRETSQRLNAWVEEDRPSPSPQGEGSVPF